MRAARAVTASCMLLVAPVVLAGESERAQEAPVTGAPVAASPTRGPGVAATPALPAPGTASPRHDVRRPAASGADVRFGDGVRGRRLPAGRATNPKASAGGSASAPASDASKRTPERLRHRNRAVTKEDASPLARETPGVTIHRPVIRPEPNSGKNDTRDESDTKDE